MRGLLFSGTDTGVGKTFLTAAVARTWRRQGHSFRVCKPVATGAVRHGSGWLAEDTRLLAEAAGDEDYQQITPWAFPVPAAPPVAAHHEGTALTLADLAGAVRRRSSPEVPVLVEGVGGLLCPLTERETVADLAMVLGLPVVVVARRSLGTLNHTLLTVEAARHRALSLAGVVINETTPVQGVAEQTNVEELRKRLDVPVLAVIPYRADPLSPAIPAAVADVDWWSLAT